MTNIIKSFGCNAGKIWKVLEKYGPLKENEIINKVKINKNEFYAGVGWLARENKILKIGTKYQLGETNLTNDIGNNAGKVWNILNSTQNIDISSISESSQIKIKDAYHALGWLARENKIQATTDRIRKFRLQ